MIRGKLTSLGETWGAVMGRGGQERVIAVPAALPPAWHRGAAVNLVRASVRHISEWVFGQAGYRFVPATARCRLMGGGGGAAVGAGRIAGPHAARKGLVGGGEGPIPGRCRAAPTRHMVNTTSGPRVGRDVP